MSLESAAREWLKGCSCAAGNNPEACEECTRAYRIAVVKELAALDNHPAPRTLAEKVYQKDSGSEP